MILQKNLRMAAFCLPLALSLSLLCAALCPLPSGAATLDTLDKQRQQAQPQPKAQPPLRLQAEEMGQMAPNSKLRFTLASLRVEGATAFSERELLAPYAALTGTQVGFAAINKIAVEMTKKYRDAGYLLSRVLLPAQKLEPVKANIRLVAVEGYIASVEYVGEENLVARFRSYFSGVEAKLTGQRPLRHQDFERQMLLLRDLPGITVSSRFKEGAERGASILVLTVAAKTVSGSVGWDNSGTKSAGPYMFNASVSLAALPLIGAKTTISYNQAFNYREYHSIELAESYQFSSGLLLQGSYAYSASPDPSTDFARQFGYSTDSNTVTVGASYPFIRSRDVNLSAGLSFVSRDTRGDALDQRLSTDRLRGLTATVTFDMADAWRGVTQVIPSFTSGLNIFGATDEAWDASNPLAPANYAKFNIYLSRNQQLFGAFSLFAAASAQLTDSPLSSYNQFQLGGAQFGRGFEPGIIKNDNGAAFTIEPRWTHALTGKTAIQPYLFYDWGRAWSEEDVAGMPDAETLASLGIGVRLWGHVGRDNLPDFNMGFYASKGLQDIRGKSEGNRCGVQMSFLF
ncbi:MAG: hypothetical protein LBH14_01310 [Desulfobulbaceae bacterium]|jgi:hemolysin activation/secretion protein|nr:hypothetical protein [Desulfobulbaceae bacterium]